MARWKYEFTDEELPEEDRGRQAEMKGAADTAITGLQALVDADARIFCSWCDKARPWSRIYRDPNFNFFDADGASHCDVCRRYKRMKGHWPYRVVGR